MICATHLPGCPVIVTGTNSAIAARRAARDVLKPDEHLGAAVRIPGEGGRRAFAYPVITDPDVGLLDDREAARAIVDDKYGDLFAAIGVEPAPWQRELLGLFEMDPEGLRLGLQGRR